MSFPACPLCRNCKGLAIVSGPDQREYFHCPDCWLVFADPRHHLAMEDEAARYRLHRNSLEDAGYVAFLRQAIDPLLPRLRPSMRGLDYGCGPSPTLSRILAQHGLRCDDYDPLFFSEELEPTYDFVFATECFEHFFRPADEVARLRSLLPVGGYLAIMTEPWDQLEKLPTWYYMHDPTHVVFYHRRTFDFICERFDFTRLPSEKERVVLLVRN